MATIKLCDWTKARLAQDEETTLITIGDKEFEVGEAGRAALLKQLEGMTPPGQPEVVERVVVREAPPPPLQAASPGVGIHTADDPFEPGPSSAPIAPQAAPQPQPAPQAGPAPASGDMLQIPADTRRPLPKAPESVAQRIIEDSTKFEEGSLPTLTMGGAQHREAMKKLKALEEAQNEKLRRRVQSGVRVNFDNEYGPR